MTHTERPPRILIVEDEPKIARLVADYLAGSGFEPHHLAVCRT